MQLLAASIKLAKSPQCSLVQTKRRLPSIMRDFLWGPDSIRPCLLQLCQRLPFVFSAISLRATSKPTSLCITAANNSQASGLK